MNTKKENNTLTISLEGRIDAQNAAETEKAIFAAVREAPDAELVLDADRLEYISSSGLRILLRLKKEIKKELTVLNVRPEVYDIFDVTGFTQMLDVRRKLREVSVDGCELIGRGGNGAVYRLDDETILKLYNEGTTLEKIAMEKKYATAAFTAGLPCAIAYDTVRCGSQYGIVFELLNAVTVGRAVDQDPDRIPELGRAMGGLLRQLHSAETPEGVLPTVMEKSGGLDRLSGREISEPWEMNCSSSTSTMCARATLCLTLSATMSGMWWGRSRHRIRSSCPWE